MGADEESEESAMNYPEHIACDTQPLTMEILKRCIDDLFRKREPVPERFPRQVVDIARFNELRIKSFYDPIADMHFTSISEMKRAKEGGAIWYENEDGSRV